MMTECQREGKPVNIAWEMFDGMSRLHLNRLRQEDKLSDVTLSNGTENIKCHRVILASSSPYFEKLFEDIPANTHMIVFLKDAAGWELNGVVNFMYSGKTEVPNKDCVNGLCELGRALQIRGLRKCQSTNREKQDVEFQEQTEGNKGEVQNGGKKSNHEGLVVGRLNGSARLLANRDNEIKSKTVIEEVRSKTPGTGSSGSRGGTRIGAIIPTTAELTSTAKTEAEEPEGEEEKDDKEQEEQVEVPVEQEFEDDEEYIEVDFDDLADPETDTEGFETQEELPQTSRARKDQGQPARSFTVVGGRKVYKYEKWERDQAMSALQGGLSLRQCSDVFNIPRKTLAKWRCQGNGNSPDYTDGQDSTTTAGPSSSQQDLNVFFTEPPISFPPLDGNDRAERLKKAASLALAGVTVRQAAVHYALPRTTLCAYMKRQGLNGLKKPTSAVSSRNTITSSNKVVKCFKKLEPSQDSSEGFPFLGLSELVDNNEVHGWSAEQGYVDEESDCFQDDEPQQRKKARK